FVAFFFHVVRGAPGARENQPVISHRESFSLKNVALKFRLYPCFFVSWSIPCSLCSFTCDFPILVSLLGFPNRSCSIGVHFPTPKHRRHIFPTLVIPRTYAPFAVAFLELGISMTLYYAFRLSSF